ncbi:MAG: hypothetical protein L3J54_05955 [Draconibacterium sp.]|nr:hypothetical protein [Draconibacterium sp.]
MKVRIYIIIVFSVFVFSCNSSKKQKREQPKLTKDAVQTTEYTSNSGKKFIFSIDHSLGASIDYVEIKTSGFEIINTTHILGETDPVEEVFLADLDKNGYEEIYLLTRSAGSGSYSNIYGMASNKDKSATPIFVPEISEKQMEKGGLFEGFMGHNKFTFEDGKLVNKFPVYLKKDINAKSTGGSKMVEYKLIAGEAGWILKPKETVK